MLYTYKERILWSYKCLSGEDLIHFLNKMIDVLFEKQSDMNH